MSPNYRKLTMMPLSRLVQQVMTEDVLTVLAKRRTPVRIAKQDDYWIVTTVCRGGQLFPASLRRELQIEWCAIHKLNLVDDGSLESVRHTLRMVG